VIVIFNPKIQVLKIVIKKKRKIIMPTKVSYFTWTPIYHETFNDICFRRVKIIRTSGIL